MFACEQAGIAPDFLCLSKGLTGGYLPLSVVLTSDAVYDAFYDEYSSSTAFLHSHSYTGNPLACAAALATLDIFARGSRDRAQPRARARTWVPARGELARSPHVAEIRQTRHDPRHRAGAERRSRRAPTTGASGAACASTGTGSSTGAAAADRQRRLLHAAVRHRAGADRRAGRAPHATGSGSQRAPDPRALSPRRWPQGGEAALPDAGGDARHARAAARAGDPLTVFDGRGSEITPRSPRSPAATVRVASCCEHVAGRPESPLAITLVQGVARGERMDWIVQKATELGVSAIAPVLAARSVVRLDAGQAGAQARALAGDRRRRLRAIGPQRAAGTATAGAAARMARATDRGRFAPRPRCGRGRRACRDACADRRRGAADRPRGRLRRRRNRRPRAAPAFGRHGSVRACFAPRRPAIAALAVLQSRWGDLAAPRAPERYGPEPGSQGSSGSEPICPARIMSVPGSRGRPWTSRAGFAGTVGNTPLIRLDSFSRDTGCEILGKAEFMNPGGSVKDRAALGILDRRRARADG